MDELAADSGYMAMSQSPGTLGTPKKAGLWMFIPLKMVIIGIDPYPYAILIDVSSAESRAFGLEGSQVAAKFGKEEGHLGKLEIFWRIMMYHDMLMIC